MTKHDDRMTRLGERVATLCDMSGLAVLGFVVLIDNPESGTLTAEARSHVAPAMFDDMIRAYVETRGDDA